jgi:hypothetical protein
MAGHGESTRKLMAAGLMGLVALVAVAALVVLGALGALLRVGASFAPAPARNTSSRTTKQWLPASLFGRSEPLQAAGK